MSINSGSTNRSIRTKSENTHGEQSTSCFAEHLYSRPFQGKGTTFLVVRCRWLTATRRGCVSKAPLQYKVHWLQVNFNSCGVICRGSRVDLHGNNGEDGVLVSTANNKFQGVVLLHGCADVSR